MSGMKNSLLLEFLLMPRFRVTRHILLLTLIALAMYSGRPRGMSSAILYGKIGGYFLLVGLFYINMYILVPKLLFRNKYIEYGIAILIITIISYLFGRAIILIMEKEITPNIEDRVQIATVLFVFVILMAASAAVKLFQRWITDNQRIVELEKMTIQAELEQLKAQINPHFLFNMLNNASVLTRNDPERASHLLVKLSKLLRYQLYDCARNQVLLSADIDFLTDLLNLEKIRRDDFEFSITNTGKVDGVQVPPLLFTTFVENAVKHGLDGEFPSYIDVHFEVEQGTLQFTCVNSKPARTSQKIGGLGLANVKRRLELTYRGNHMLKITDEPLKFGVLLKIVL